MAPGSPQFKSLPSCRNLSSVGFLIFVALAKQALVEVPQRPDAAALPDDVGLVAKVRSCLGDKLANDLEWQLELHRKQGNTPAAEELRDRWFGRMWDISAFMKVFNFRQLRTGVFG